MSVKEHTGDLGDLRHFWRSWMRVVAQCTRRVVRRPRISPAEYNALQHTLLDACRCLEKESKDDPERHLFQKMAGLVQPWVTLDSLMRANRHTLNELLSRSRGFECQLGGRSVSTGWSRLIQVSLVIAILVGLIVLSLPYWTDGHLLNGLFYAARNSYYDATNTISGASFLTKVSFITVAMVLVGTWLLSNTRRY